MRLDADVCKRTGHVAKLDIPSSLEVVVEMVDDLQDHVFNFCKHGDYVCDLKSLSFGKTNIIHLSVLVQSVNDRGLSKPQGYLRVVRRMDHTLELSDFRIIFNQID